MPADRSHEFARLVVGLEPRTGQVEVIGIRKDGFMALDDDLYFPHPSRHPVEVAETVFGLSRVRVFDIDDLDQATAYRTYLAELANTPPRSSS